MPKLSKDDPFEEAEAFNKLAIQNGLAEMKKVISMWCHKNIYCTPLEWKARLTTLISEEIDRIFPLFFNTYSYMLFVRYPYIKDFLQELALSIIRCKLDEYFKQFSEVKLLLKVVPKVVKSKSEDDKPNNPKFFEGLTFFIYILENYSVPIERRDEIGALIMTDVLKEVKCDKDVDKLTFVCYDKTYLQEFTIASKVFPKKDSVEKCIDYDVGEVCVFLSKRGTDILAYQETINLIFYLLYTDETLSFHRNPENNSTSNILRSSIRQIIFEEVGISKFLMLNAMCKICSPNSSPEERCAECKTKLSRYNNFVSELKDLWTSTEKTKDALKSAGNTFFRKHGLII